MGSFDDFTKAVLTGVAGLAQDTVKGFEQNARADAQAFINGAKADLQTWTTQLAKGQINKSEFGDLVAGEKDLAKLAALTQAGIALATLQRFRDGLIDLVVKAAFDTFL